MPIIQKNIYRKTITLVLLLFFWGCGGNSDPSEDSKLSSQSKNPSELIQIAAEKQRIGAYDEAIAILHGVLELDPKFISAYTQMGLVYGEADQRNKAIESYNKALEMEPKNLQARLGLAEVYSKMTRNDLAVAEFLKAESLQPKDKEILFKIALEYWYDQKLNEAAEYYNKILAIDPNHTQAHLNLISVYEKLKDWEKALQEIEISKQLGKENNNDQTIAIAVRKLAFIKGRMNMTDKDYKRKSQPPFE
ncbi:MAG: tetratricopeptide repeat protein [Nitrospina sp.]|jgi:Tfp pilus assembly protein PilF|nr:tetratricopeptide repeat protein [Nitrospina sp.]